MELKIKTLKGSCVLLIDLKDTKTVGQLQALLHQQHKGDPLDIPQPEHQRLVFKQAVLPADTALQQAGIANGDQLVLLVPRKLQQPSPPQILPAPDAAAIRAAITDEARQQGLEHTLREERPPAAPQRRSIMLPPELLGQVDGELLQLLEQALSGAGGNILQGLRLSGSGDGSQEQQAQEEEEEEGEEGDIQPPEPSAGHLAQLADMGFSEALARKALQLTRDNVELALEWLLQHGEEPGAADPPTQEQLRTVYGRRRRRAAGAAAGAGAAAAAGAPVEAVLSQLTDMGFEAAAAQQALARVGPNLDLAVTLLLGQGLSAAMASARGSRDDSRDEEPAAAAGDAAAAAAAGGAAAAEAAQQDEDDEMAELLDDDEEEEEYEDAAEDEYVSEYEDTDVDEDDEEGPALPLHLEQALGTMGSMDLQGLGSSDMEQLLQGVAIQDLVGNQLLMSGSMEGGMGGMAGPQGALLRLMEAPGLLQQMFAGLQDPAAAGQQQEAQEQPDGTQQQQQQQAQSAAEEQEAAGEGRLQQQQWEAGDQPEAEADDASGYS
uniref:UBA domain-containing protein n=1 Tax=Tetradesmus obliquus TaxID=3088 RepID=A0A383W8V9_TETOB|eukprot:jgi/Sobl393_1/16831/SZX74052.1